MTIGLVAATGCQTLTPTATANTSTTTTTAVTTRATHSDSAVTSIAPSTTTVPHSSSAPGSTPDPNRFTSVIATVLSADGETCELCVWLADTPAERRVGLMHVTDLDQRDGMVFVYADPRTTNFWMKDTLIPLSISFFAADGVFLDAFDMHPCTSDPCEEYPTPRDITFALEVPLGDLADFGIGPGATLSVSDLPCSSSTGSDATGTDTGHANV